ncbi:pyridoxamine 5'-phosphate oxidase family protein [Rhabdobacter roseus]|uniref:General stress protein 26 n=1 Tax=Rhabdobacter roseus TaxID=1655419 RepID=A0A840TJT4_9BACT|nr:pyridoxamine 5'-phosphate oxidase family protein [Rhabdobacter roseus]MBB5282057.1 general stress protein 26 [Rhabdobacter roseus]
MKTEETTQQLDKIQELIDKIEVGMLTTMESNGDHRSRPMQTQKFDADGCLWFFTSRSSPKTDELIQHPDVNLSYADKDSHSYVSITGTASIEDDPALKEELWNSVAKAWFPKGLEDPDLTLLKVKIKEAEYWDSTSSNMVQAYHIAKALITGEQYDEGEHKKVQV